MRRPVQRTLAGLALTASLATTGCYPLTVNAYDVDKPVSLSQSIGQKVRFARHFRHEFVTWYAIGLIPLISVPGPVPLLTPADRMVGEVLKSELRKGGDGIVNLKVTQQYNWLCMLAHYVPFAILGALGAPNPGGVRVTAPLAPVWLVLIPPMGATIEGDVIALATAAERPAGMIVMAGDRLDTGKLSLRRLVTDALRPRRAAVPD